MSHRKLASKAKSLLERIKKKDEFLYHKRERQLARFNRGLKGDVKRLKA